MGFKITSTISLLLFIFSLLLMNSCSEYEKEKNGQIRDSLLKNKIKQDSILKNSNGNVGKSMRDKFEFVGDSVLLPEFDIELKLSDSAEKKLKLEQESVIVQAYFSGVPKDKTMKEYIEWGEISIGSFRVELFEERIAIFENVKISKKDYDLLSDKNFQVLINVFTGRRKSEDNLLSTGIIQDGIDVIKAKRHIINGKLIYGD